MHDLLQFEGVSSSGAAAGSAGLHEVSFAVGPGELVLLETEAEGVALPVADLAAGLVPPEVGRVLFEGTDWTGRTADAAAAARVRIGRVFAGPAWLSNLDLDENITLPMRYHRVLKDEQAHQQAVALAARFGLDPLPAGRPAHVARPHLRLAEWVRALLGPRSLLILEYPLREVPRRSVEALLQELEQRRSAGLGVLWIQGPDAAALRPRLKPALHFKVESGHFVRVDKHE